MRQTKSSPRIAFEKAAFNLSPPYGGEGYYREDADFVRACIERRPAQVGWDEGLAVQRDSTPSIDPKVSSASSLRGGHAMTPHLPPCLVGTTRVAASARPAFGAFLDGAAAGFRGTLLTEGSTWVWDTLKQGGRNARWDVWAIVPHVAGYVREVTDYGMLGAGWRRVRRINPLSGGRLFFQGFLNARGVLRRDFPTLLTLLLELEMANFRKAKPGVVFLHSQMTDLLLAMDHGPALKRAIDRIRMDSVLKPDLRRTTLVHSSRDCKLGASRFRTYLRQSTRRLRNAARPRHLRKSHSLLSRPGFRKL